MPYGSGRQIMTGGDFLHQAMAHHQAGRVAEAERLYRAVLETQPRNPDAHHNLGVLAIQTGRPHEALAFFKAAVEVAPRLEQCWFSYLDALVAVGEAETADHVLGQARRQGLGGPRIEALAGMIAAMAYANQCFAGAVSHHHAGRLAEAVDLLRRILVLSPFLAEHYSNLGSMLRDLGRLAEAETCCRRALAIQPALAEAYGNLANVLRDLGRLDEAVAAFQAALSLRPDFAQVHGNLAHALLTLGRADAAMRACGRAMALHPHDPELHRELLLLSVYAPDLDQAARFALHRAFDARHARRFAPLARSHAVTPEPDRRLRIGYLSSDFLGHPVARNLLPVLRAHDRTRFEIHAYAGVARPDGVTQDIRALCDGWHSTLGLDDAAVAEMIRADGIDILVCLAARFDANRPLVCALRPAPVQVSFHDCGTSGLVAMDYLLSDRGLTPRHTKEGFAERLLCLPRFYVADMPAILPPVQDQSGDRVVFGCFNNPAKISERVLRLWARVLHAVPGSTLRLKYHNWYEAGSLRRQAETVLGQCGIGPERLSCPPRDAALDQHLGHYNGIDIALDPFPFSGSTSTFEALIMGVPVVTLAGDVMVSRWSAAMLAALGLDDLVATDPDHYVAIAADLARDSRRRRLLRHDLRGQVAGSSLCDGPGRTRQIERFYRAIWRRWCMAR